MEVLRGERLPDLRGRSYSSGRGVGAARSVCIVHGSGCAGLLGTVWSSLLSWYGHSQHLLLLSGAYHSGRQIMQRALGK